MNRNAWIIFVVICVALIGGLVLMSQSNRVDVSGVDQHQALPASEESGNLADRTKGSDDPVVTIVEYADFQCPGCANAAPVLSQVIEDYGDHVQLIFRHFPLTNIHPNARAAAAASEAAGIQGSFWQMHNHLFTTQNEWAGAGGTERTDIFAGYAESLGLNREQFLEDLTSREVSAKINYDSALGRDAGVNSTPTIYVDGELLNQYYLDEELVSAGTEGAAQVWTNAEAFGKLIIEPKLREAGVEL